MKVGIIGFTSRGADLCRRLAWLMRERAEGVSACVPDRFLRAGDEETGVEGMRTDLHCWTGRMFAERRALVFVGAAGIAVRAIAPFIKDKLTDPPVVVVDEAGRFCIPLLSGHVGGANELASDIAGWIGATPVITTATDVNHIFAVDVFAARNGLAITDRAQAKDISAGLLEGRPVGFFNDFSGESGMDWPVPEGCASYACGHNIWITARDGGAPEDCGKLGGTDGRRTFLRLVPRAAVLGIGCRKGIGTEALERQVKAVLARGGIDLAAVKAAATIDIKKEEPALVRLAAGNGWTVRTYTAEELQAVEGVFEESGFVKDTVGVGNVCERACAAGGGRLILHKQAGNGVTVAVAWEGIGALEG